MIRRWLRGCLVPSALCLTAVGCTSSVESLTGALAVPWAPAPKTGAPDVPPTPTKGDMTVDEQLLLHLEAGRKMDRAGNDEGALVEYERILELDSANLTAMRRLCVLYDRQASWDKAEEMYRKVARLKPKDADLLSDWGYSLYLRAGEKNWKEAESKLRLALQINPTHTRAHSNLGLVLGELKRYPEAYTEFRAAQLSEAEAHCDMAFVYWCQSLMEEAKQECRKARELDSSCVKARNMLVALEQEPHPREKPAGGGRPAAAHAEKNVPRASALTQAQWEAEHEAAKRAVLGAGPAPVEDKSVSWQSSGAVTLPSGNRWMPVGSSATPPAKSAAPAPTPATGGAPGVMTFDN